MRKHLELPSSFSLNIDYIKDKNLLYVGTEDGSGATYSCKNLDDVTKDIEIYCENYLVNYIEKGEELC